MFAWQLVFLIAKGRTQCLVAVAWKHQDVQLVDVKIQSVVRIPFHQFVDELLFEVMLMIPKHQQNKYMRKICRSVASI